MTKPLPPRTLTRGECLALLTEHPGHCVGSVSVGGRAPTRLVCFPQRDGSVVIPTGRDAELVAAALAEPVIEISFDEVAPQDGFGWTVSGRGHARPLGRRDRPRATNTTTALAMSSAFEHGIRLRFEALSGQRVALP